MITDMKSRLKIDMTTSETTIRNPNKTKKKMHLLHIISTTTKCSQMIETRGSREKDCIITIIELTTRKLSIEGNLLMQKKKNQFINLFKKSMKFQSLPLLLIISIDSHSQIKLKLMNQLVLTETMIINLLCSNMYHPPFKEMNTNQITIMNP